MRKYSTLLQALEAIEREVIVDEVDNDLDRELVEELIAFSDADHDLGVYVMCHVRYDGDRAIRWFDGGPLGRIVWPPEPPDDGEVVEDYSDDEPVAPPMRLREAA